jgi:2-dehydro-3-deoxyphosphogluconate aldolase/(4S)-4-hydroxy-2-oxoglutarate aldolase
MNQSFSYDLFNKMPIIGIMRNLPEQHVEVIAEKYHRSGLTCLEITMNSPNAGKQIARIAGLYGSELNVGAGTVCSMRDLEQAIKSNAQFIVTPIINEEVIKACVAEKIPIFPGAYTPSEIYRAWSLGASMIKLFPASDLKPNYIKEVMAPLNYVSLIPTGGITLENFTGYLDNGARGVGVGSHLFPKEIIQNEDWSALSSIFLQFAEKYNSFISKTGL